MARFGGSPRTDETPKKASRVLEVIRNGCSLRPTVFGNFVRLPASALLEDPTNVVYHAPFRAFRFAESDTVTLQCKVVVCYGRCPGVEKSCPQTLVDRSLKLGFGRHEEEDSTRKYGKNYNAANSEEILHEKPPVVVVEAGDRYLPDGRREAIRLIPGYANPAFDDRLKRGTATVRASPLQFSTGQEDRNGSENRISGDLVSGGTVIEFGRAAVVWAKCSSPSDMVVVTLNDPAGFTGDITIERLLEVTESRPHDEIETKRRSEFLAQLARHQPSNRLKREVDEFEKQASVEVDNKRWAIRERDAHRYSHTYPMQLPRCAVFRENFNEVREATIVRKSDCLSSIGPFKPSMKFVVTINSNSGLAKTGLLDCSEKFVVLE